MDTLSLHLMDTDFYIAVPEQEQISWKVHVENWLQYVATEWSRFRDDNELSQLNQLPVGQRLQLSTELYDCLKKANQYYMLSDGLFSPYLKLQLERHGYKQTLSQTKACIQKANAIADTSTPFCASLSQPFVFLNNCQVMKLENQEVDLGGFAKGYAVEKTAEWLQQQGLTEYGIVDGGGDMTMWSASEKEWKIGIADPYDSDKEVSYIKMKNGAIATSNRLYRCWTQGTSKKHHILNGQTGEIAETPIVQVSVVANSLCEAEVATKLCFLLDEFKQDKWFNKNYGKTARFIITEHEPGHWHMTKGEHQHVS